MILELDCGNTLIKWRVISRSGTECICSGLAESDNQLFAMLAQRGGLNIAHCRLVSVRSEAETLNLMAELDSALSLRAVCAAPAKQLAGVRNGYEAFDRLGLDRWLAVLGAYHLGRRACLVLDLGTAVTADLVAANGEHLGGFIAPGLSLMRSQLSDHTRRIRYDLRAAELASDSIEPGRSTAEAVERGCMLMLRGFAMTQLLQAQKRFPEGLEVFLTGGDAELVRDCVPGAQFIPDLVFVGLAIACPID